MKRGDWAKGKDIKVPTKEEILAKDDAWCHAVCLGIAEGQMEWENVPEVSPAIKAVKKLRRDYEYERDKFRPAQGAVASSPTSGNIDMLRGFAEGMRGGSPQEVGEDNRPWEQRWFESAREARK